MVEKALIQEIVSTYELPAKVQERLVGRAFRYCEERDIQDFDSIYHYIATLVEYRQEPKKELSLETCLGESNGSGDEFTLKQTIKTEDAQLANLFRISQGLKFSDALRALQKRAAPDMVEVMQQLYERSNGDARVDPRTFRKVIPTVEKFAASIKARYEVNGRIVIPQRPVIGFDAQRAEIMFGRRSYNGNPLAFFRENREVYQGLTRMQLERIDLGLYTALQKKRQLSIAIPYKAHQPHPEEIQRVLALYKERNGNATKFAKERGHAPKTVLDIWKSHGLRTKHQRLSLEDKEWVKRVFLEKNRNLSATGKKTGISPSTVLKLCREANLETRVRKVPEEVRRKIDEGYEKFGGNGAATARYAGCHLQTVHSYWKKQGRKASGRVVTEVKEREIIERWKETKCMDKTARELGYCPNTVASVLYRRNIVKKKEMTPISEEEKKEIIEKFTQFKSIHALSTYMQRDDKSVKRILVQHGFKIRERRLIPREEEESIVAAFEKFHGEPYVAAHELNRDGCTIKKIWKKHGKIEVNSL